MVPGVGSKTVFYGPLKLHSKGKFGGGKIGKIRPMDMKDKVLVF